QIWAPIPQDPTNITQTSFTANWSAPISATKYYLQLATDASFHNIVPGYDNLDAGLALSRTISGLSNANTYYYRLRSFFVSGYSMYSPYMAVTLSASATAQLNSGTALTEYNLNAAILQLNLVNTTWSDNTLQLSNFTLHNAPIGLILLSVQYLDPNRAQLQLNYDNTDFDSNVLDFSVTINASEIDYASNLQTNALPIIAYIESPLTIQITGQQLILNIQPVAEAEAYFVFSSGNPYGVYVDISSDGNFDLLNPTRWNCSLPTDNYRFYRAAAIKQP
ncbi:MAG: ribonuclease, partial [Candidatus Cloacimonas sp.]